MRRRHFIGFSILLISLVLVPFQPLRAAETSWKVGLASAKITPEKPIWQAGYGSRDHPAEGTLHDLWIKVLVLEAANGDRAVVLTSDILGFPKKMYDGICAELETRFGLDRSRVMLTASHTHSGPVLKDALYDIYPLDDEQRALIEKYSLALEETVVETVAKALSEPVPATPWAGEGTTDVAVNRRNNSRDQVTEMRKQGIPLKGPSDHDVSVLAVRSPEGALRAVVFGYACHATTLSGYDWSGDYPGFAQIALEKSHPGAAAMFHAGCGADQNPLPRRTVELCQKYGEMLAGAVDDVLEKPMRPIRPTLATALEMLDLDYEKALSRADLEAGKAKNIYYKRRAERLLARLDAGETLAASYPYPVQAWKLGGEQLWITMGGEVVVDYSLRFKSTYGPKTWVSGYTNDVMSYIPSRRVWEEGGYESGAFYVYGLPTDRWTPKIEERIADSVERLVEKLD
ncbi:MAG: neutral/alkaline non-lysosomal ceramidase N-terminal domain-containing protein [Planctomycetes bacterium]|nr:neutral/alkaline non-lysosomal ceramidase N-terminal domain-containing protein [Planctomycetota bacterium]